ncbi:MAG: DUF6701 domain-containing protein [Telluria sp.]
MSARLVRWAVCALLLLGGGVARADTAISLQTSFSGNVNFAGTQATARTASNDVNPCSVKSTSQSVTAVLSGIPTGATVKAAYLYWAASGSTATSTVYMDGSAVNAARTYTSTYVNGGTYYYFRGSTADVTTAVAAKGNGTYTFRGLIIDSSSTYCSVSAVLGGYALLVVYSSDSEPFRVLNIYEGFRYVRYDSLTLTLSNFQIPSPLGTSTGRVGHITWEGDPDLAGTDENLTFNGYTMTDSMNPVNYQFNSSSNINNDANSYGIDFDAYTVTSPTIQAGQTSATTVYSTGQDLVLLHAEIVAVPNVPVQDLFLQMVLSNSTVTLGEANSYKITITNKGSDSPSSTITVSDTLPSNVAVNSAGGSGWTCGISGQVVTCTFTGSLAVNGSLPDITIGFTPTSTSSSTVSNTATVSSTAFDNVSTNNSATVSASLTTPSYVFTNGSCISGYSFGSATQNQYCTIYNFGAPTAGTALSNIYITALVSGVPTYFNRNNPRTSSFYFGLSCVDPTANAGVQANFSAVGNLPLCAANGGSIGTSTRAGPASITFPASSPSSSVPYTFTYKDVGKVQLYMVDSTNTVYAQSGNFVVKPASIKLTNVMRTSDSLANPAPSSASAANSAFAKAGDAFSMTVGAYESGGALTPNFGKESSPASFALSVARLAAYNSTNMPNLPSISGSFGAISGGQASGTAFSWDAVGIVATTPGVYGSDYLGAGSVTGVTTNIGRFIPASFATSVTTSVPSSSCVNCPSGMPADVGGIAYSKQPSVSVTVTARTSTGATATNYDSGSFAEAVTLATYTAAGGATASTTTISPTTVAAANFTNGVSSAQVVTPTMATTTTLPTAIYVRSTLTDTPTIVSNSSTVGASASVVEGGAYIVNGRLRISNAYGPETLPLPLGVAAQYLNASGVWLTSGWDNVSTLVPSPSNTKWTFNNFTKNLSTLTVSESSTLTVAKGLATVHLNGNGSGSAQVQWTTNGSAWLPTTTGTVMLGGYRTPVIHIRETY